MHKNMKRIPESYRHDVVRAVEIAKDAGCTDVYLFGSLKDGEVHSGSDIDLAVRGCPPGRYFSLWGTLMLTLKHPIDLINLDMQQDFATFLEDHEELLPIG